jgi:hypothetical protein
MALYGYNPELRFDINIKDAATKGGTLAASVLAACDRILRLQELRDQLREELLKS